MRAGVLLAALSAAALLSGCAGDQAKAEYKHHPRAFMREVVNCESHYRRIGQTRRCRQALRLNASLFNPR